jgi:hypothetical protein
MAVTRYNAVINQEIELGMHFIRSGVSYDPYKIHKVEILDSKTLNILETITTITREDTGCYNILASKNINWNILPRTVIDKWYYSPTSNSSVLTDESNTVIMSISVGDSGLPTPLDIRTKYLYGLNLTDSFGESMGDDTIQYYIDAAVEELEKEISIDIKPRKVISNATAEEVCDISEPAYDFYVNDYANFAYTKLFRRPVKSIDKVEIIYPTGQKVLDIDPRWIKLYRRQGIFQLVPTYGTYSTILIGKNGPLFPLLSASFFPSMPQMLHVDYTTGFDIQEFPRDLHMAIGKRAAIEILTVMSDAIAQGISNSNIHADGLTLSMSRTNSINAVLFQGRIDTYNKWLDRYLKNARDYFYGVGLEIV